ncbi:GerAB/ArcD/ProY family transporter [Metabacillus halosaccharovorans]|uniref:Spore germination protein n=1 Tax=Metabacillus halosaccharovorans TaxID=930124 RepID=A0ABT3DES9_9BACI|nr:spore germination protein [Metabacillus halosaccharovorans]MCV9885376.1 spore germination protein [Metabacillus halosaccharovorans]
MEHPREITTATASGVLISTIIGVGVLPLPLFAVQANNTGAPLVTVIAIILAFIGLSVITILGMRYPNHSIIGYSQKIIGKWLGLFLGILFVLFFSILTGLASREFGSVVISAVLKETPLEVTVFVMLVLAAFTTRHDMTTFAYIQLFYLPFILAPALIIVVLSLKNGNILYLQPVWGNEPDIRLIISGVFIIAALFQGSFVMTIIIPSMKKARKAMKASIWAIIISGGLYTLIVIATVSVFGTEETRKLIWPTLELARTTSLPGNILQRLDIIFLAIWVVSVFTTLLTSYKLTIHMLSQLLGLSDHKMMSFFILPFFFLLAMIPQNVLQMYEIIRVVGQIGLILTIGIPVLLLLIDSVKRKRRANNEHISKV